MIYIKFSIILLCGVLFSILFSYVVFSSNLKTYNLYKKYYKRYMPIRKKMALYFIYDIALYIIPFIWLFYSVIFYKGNMDDIINPIITLFISHIIACFITPTDIAYYMYIIDYNGNIDLEMAKEEQLR